MFGRTSLTEMHAWVEERLSDYIDNQLAPSERARLDKHLTECSQCRTSLESLKWTVSLVKQAPSPISKRSFTLVVPPMRQPTFAFGFATFATALATLLLFALIGVDLITQLGGGSLASAPAVSQAAKQDVSATQQVALAPQPTATPPVSLFAAPTSAPAPLPPATVPPVATKSAERNGVTDSITTTVTLDNAPKSQVATPAARQPLAGSAATSATVNAPTATLSPTRTTTPVPPTETLAPTTIAQAQPLPTRGPIPQPVTQAQPIVSPLRIAELGLLFVVVFFGVLVALLRRR